MNFALLLVALVIGALDPVLWIAPIIAAFFSKGRWWLVPLAAVVWGGILEFAVRPQLDPGYAGQQAGLHLASALLNGFVVLGIAGLIRKLRGATKATAAQDRGPAAGA
jgi:hypothetical protein